MVRRREDCPGLAGMAAVPDGPGERETGQIGVHAKAARMGIKVEAKSGDCYAERGLTVPEGGANGGETLQRSGRRAKQERHTIFDDGPGRCFRPSAPARRSASMASAIDRAENT